MEHFASKDESKRLVSASSPAYPPKLPSPWRTLRNVTGCTDPPAPATTAISSALTTPSFSFQLSLRTVKRFAPVLRATAHESVTSTPNGKTAESCEKGYSSHNSNSSQPDSWPSETKLYVDVYSIMCSYTCWRKQEQLFMFAVGCASALVSVRSLAFQVCVGDIGAPAW